MLLLQRGGPGRCVPIVILCAAGHRGLVPRSIVHLSLLPTESTVRCGATARGKGGRRKVNMRRMQAVHSNHGTTDSLARAERFLKEDISHSGTGFEEEEKDCQRELLQESIGQEDGGSV